MLNIFARASVSRVTDPIGQALVRAGLTPNVMTVFGTAGAVVSALAFFPNDHLLWGTFTVWGFAMLDILDGAMARARGYGTPFGAVLDATCDRIGDGAVFCGLLWWAAFGLKSPSLVVATLICLVTSQVISYIKARAEATGLRGQGGFIERPERLIIVLTGAGVSDLPFHPLPWTLPVAMWVLAAASLITVAQRLHTVRTSPGATETVEKPETSEP
jgi:CDP-diacylglycerol---glycerol-3-phosphate 3-phosphatidyltransferase